MRLNPRLWLAALVTGLFGLATLTVPTLHLRALSDGDPISAAYVSPDGSLPEICGSAPSDHDGHRLVAHCLACMLVAAPGLLSAPAAARMPAAAVAAIVPPQARSRHTGLAWAPQHARAPPLRSSV